MSLQGLLERLLATGWRVALVPRACLHPEFVAPSVVVFALRRLPQGGGGGGAGRVEDFEEGFLRLAQVRV